jgi:putative transposase
MENQMTLSGDSIELESKITIRSYKSYGSSVGSNLKSIQITTKYRYQMLRQEKLRVFCKVAIEEACKRHKIEIIVLRILNEHSHMIVECPRTVSDSALMQIIKGLSSYILFRLCPDFRKRYPRGEFWNDGYFCEGCGSDFDKALRYIENQEQHHYGH